MCGDLSMCYYRCFVVPGTWLLPYWSEQPRGDRVAMWANAQPPPPPPVKTLDPVTGQWFLGAGAAAGAIRTGVAGEGLGGGWGSGSGDGGLGPGEGEGNEEPFDVAACHAPVTPKVEWCRLTQVDPGLPAHAFSSQRLKLTYDTALSKLAFNFETCAATSRASCRSCSATRPRRVCCCRPTGGSPGGRPVASVTRVRTLLKASPWSCPTEVRRAGLLP